MKIPNTCLIYSFLLDKYMYYNTQEEWEYMGNSLTPSTPVILNLFRAVYP